MEKKYNDENDVMNRFYELQEQVSREKENFTIKNKFLPGYSKKQVNELIERYTSTIGWMQEAFSLHLKEIALEKDKMLKERVSLQRQLAGAVEKSNEIQTYRDKIEELKRGYFNLEKKSKEVNDRYLELKNQEETIRKEYADLKESYDKLSKQSEVDLDNLDSDSIIVKEFTKRMENLKFYCKTLEEQKQSLENELLGMRSINKGIENLYSEHEKRKEILKLYQKKCLTLQQENDSLNHEILSASEVLEDILFQFDEKNTENEKLKKELAKERREMMGLLKLKVELEQTNVTLKQQLYELDAKTRLANDLNGENTKERFKIQVNQFPQDKGKIVMMNGAEVENQRVSLVQRAQDISAQINMMNNKNEEKENNNKIKELV